MNSVNALGHITGTTGNLATCRIGRDALGLSRDAGGAGMANTSVGAILRIMVAGIPVFATLVDLSPGDGPDAQDAVTATAEYIGEGALDEAGMLAEFRRGLTVYAQPGDEVHFASEAELARIFSPPDVPHVTIGRVHPTQTVRAPILFDQFLGRHFAIVGSSGAGKSTTVTLLLDRIIEQAGHGHIIILDPHGEYAHAFGDRAQVWDTGNLRLPYWALNHEEHYGSESAGGSIDGPRVLVGALRVAKAGQHYGGLSRAGLHRNDGALDAIDQASGFPVSFLAAIHFRVVIGRPVGGQSGRTHFTHHRGITARHQCGDACVLLSGAHRRIVER